MKLDETETVASLPAEIINLGSGPEIKGTRITVYAIIDYLLAAWHPSALPRFFRSARSKSGQQSITSKSIKKR